MKYKTISYVTTSEVVDSDTSSSVSSLQNYEYLVDINNGMGVEITMAESGQPQYEEGMTVRPTQQQPEAVVLDRVGTDRGPDGMNKQPLGNVEPRPPRRPE